MTRIVLIALLFISFTAYSQRTKTVTNKVTRDNKFSSYTERYEVLADDKTIKHGLYEKLNHKNKILESGYYKNGKRDSIWEDFIATQGYYKNDKKIGIWTFYKNSDTIEMKYDFDNNKLLYFKNDTSKTYFVLSGPDTIKTTLQQPPIFLEGSNAIRNFIFDNITYPDEAREGSIQGRVLVGITIYEDGHSSKPWILKGVHKTIDDEALRVTALIIGPWLPGLLNGKAITSIFVQPVTFTLE